MKKLTRASLSELAKTKTIISFCEQRKYVGGGTGTTYDPFSYGEFMDSLQGNQWRGGWVQGVVNDGNSISYCGGTGAPVYVSGDITYNGGTGFYGGSQYDGYPGWDKLTDQEKDFIMSHPLLAMDFKKNSDKALEATKNLSGAHNGYGDAVRHCYWSALNQMDAGLDSNSAMQYGNAHESSPSNPNNEKTMDLHNNTAGYELGKRALKEGWSEDQLLQEDCNLQVKLQLSPGK